MGKLSRRTLMTQASVGVGAIGVLTIATACKTSDPTATTSIPTGSSAGPTDDPLAVFVTDPTKGTLKIMKGDREVTIDNPGLANSLLSLV